MNKQKALSILATIHQDIFGDWLIPHCPQYCEKEITLGNGEKATLLAEDEVYDFLDYVKKLIENEEGI